MDKQTRTEIEQELGYYIDPIMKSLLDDAKNKVLKHDFDFTFVIDGSVN